jgi:hypothetical protein
MNIIYGSTQDVRGPIVLCKTCCVLLCVFEQLRIDNSSAGPNFGAIGPFGLQSILDQPIHNNYNIIS